MPGSGDSIQALKAGVMEIPDIIVVNKADHPMTETMVREVRGVLALSHEPGRWQVPVLRTEAERGEGVAELAEKIGEHRAFIEERGTLSERRARNLRSEVIGIATSRMRRQLEAWAAEDSETAELLERVVRRELDPATAATELLERHTDA
jgi:LAO/AO transport system kinase